MCAKNGKTISFHSSVDFAFPSPSRELLWARKVNHSIKEIMRSERPYYCLWCIKRIFMKWKWIDVGLEMLTCSDVFTNEKAVQARQQENVRRLLGFRSVSSNNKLENLFKTMNSLSSLVQTEYIFCLVQRENLFFH